MAASAPPPSAAWYLFFIKGPSCERNAPLPTPTSHWELLV